MNYRMFVIQNINEKQLTAQYNEETCLLEISSISKSKERTERGSFFFNLNYEEDRTEICNLISFLKGII